MNAGIDYYYNKNFIQVFSVENVHFVKRNLLSCDLFYTFQGFLAGIYQIIYYNDIISGIL